MLNLLELIKQTFFKNPLTVQTVESSGPTPVDSYWGHHTVNSTRFKNANQSLQYLEWRSDVYPLFREFMNVYGNHDDEIVLDFGCGPGNDLVGFLAYTKAKKVIGVDISQKALNLARHRLGLHRPEPDRIELIQTGDSLDTIPFQDNYVNYIYCEGVLHHTSNPQALLREFYRISKSDARACIMVYNRPSLWFHLYTAYKKMILDNAFQGMDLMEAFSKNTDGEECPIARCYDPGEFAALCRDVGWEVEFVGGYFSSYELQLLKELGATALEDPRLGVEHKEFLKSLEYDTKDYPRYQGKHAGIGGVYRLYKPSLPGHVGRSHTHVPEMIRR